MAFFGANAKNVSANSSGHRKNRKYKLAGKATSISYGIKAI